MSSHSDLIAFAIGSPAGRSRLNVVPPLSPSRPEELLNMILKLSARSPLAEAALQEALAGNSEVAIRKSNAAVAFSKTAGLEILAVMAKP